MNFVAEAGPYPKRPVRIMLDQPVTLAYVGNTAVGTIRDLSRQGAKLQTDQRFAIGQTIRIESDQLPEIEATVCWRRHPSYGLVFRQLMSMEDLAQRVYRMQTQSRGAI
jgi:hypothetical protein